ncbi:translation initiation factor IF-2 [Sesbania bispinosa]|nr:translation initiation factor IF-2 [Sesbania bispinosa]
MTNGELGILPCDLFMQPRIGLYHASLMSTPVICWSGRSRLWSVITDGFVGIISSGRVSSVVDTMHGFSVATGLKMFDALKMFDVLPAFTFLPFFSDYYWP